MKIIRRSVLLLMCLAMLLACGCKSIGSKTLTVGTSVDLYPFSYYNNYGAITGFDIDLITALAEKTGASKVEFVTMKYNELLDAVRYKKVDCAISGISVNDERKVYVSFTDVYYTSTTTVITRSDSKNEKFEDVSELKKLDIATVEDSLGDYLATNTVKGDARVVRRKSPYLAVDEVITGRCDIALLETISAGYYLENYGNYIKAVDADIYDKKPYAIAVSSDNTELLDALNAALAEYKASGELDALVESTLIK